MSPTLVVIVVVMFLIWCGEFWCLARAAGQKKPKQRDFSHQERVAKLVEESRQLERQKREEAMYGAHATDAGNSLRRRGDAN